MIQKRMLPMVFLLWFISMGCSTVANWIQEPTNTRTPASTPTKQPTATASATPEPPTVIHWYIGLAGTPDTSQLTNFHAFIDRFNQEQAGKYVLIPEIHPQENALETLQYEISAGNSPDLVGDISVESLHMLDGQWLDLAGFIASNHFAVSDYAAGAMEAYRFGNQGQVAVPFIEFPYALYYNKSLLDASGIAYPPHRWEGTYQGKAWTFDALRTMAMKLTLDSRGRNAAQPDFNPNDIVQYGYFPQWADLHTQWGEMVPGSFVDNSGQAMIPSVWRAAAKWYYAGMWSDHFIPTAKAYQSERFGQGGVFNTGRLALMPNGSWFTWVDSDTNWDVAAMPSFQGGKPISFVSGNGFAIMKGSKHPQESFEVLALLMSTYEMDLMDYLGTGANARGLFYGGLPARLSLHSAIVERNQGNWPDVDWQVFLDAQKYETYPGGFMYLPNHKNAVEVYGKFQSRYESTPGLDIESELTKLQSELQSAFDLTTPSS